MRAFLLALSLLLAGIGPALADDDYIKMSSNGLQRQYILVTPSGRKSEPVPLIVVLHGTVGTGRKMQTGLGFDKYVDRVGFAVAYPDAYIEPGQRKTTRWNDGRGTLVSSRLNVDDVAFFRDMVKDIGQRIAIDRSRIFVTGPSNGGMMTFRAACEGADLFAGAAPVIGNIARPIADRCQPSRPISLLAINGTEDPFVPFGGGTVCKGIRKFFCEGGEVISNLDSLAVFARRAGCAAKPEQQVLAAKVAGDPPVEKVTFSHCRDGHKVAAYWIRGGGHNWPPLAGQLGDKNGPPTRNLDATQTIIEFFLGRS